MHACAYTCLCAYVRILFITGRIRKDGDFHSCLGIGSVEKNEGTCILYLLESKPSFEK